jgi:hypothetical protein
MKDFKEMTEKEKEELLKQIQNLNVDNTTEEGDSFDMLTQSFNELTKSYTNSLKEFDALHPDYLKDEQESNPLEKYESKWTTKIKSKFS